MGRSKMSIQQQAEATKLLGDGHIAGLKTAERAFWDVAGDIGDAWGHHWMTYADRLVEALISYRTQVEERLAREKIEPSRTIERPSMPRRGIPTRL